MLNIGPQELLVILVIALLVVGPQRLPALGRSLGRGLRELRKAQDEVKRTISVNLDDEPPNGSSRRPSPDRAAPGPSSTGAPGATPPPVAGDEPPMASEPLPASEVREISRSLGRSLSELRRAKEEIQRSFRVELTSSTPPDQRPPAARPQVQPAPQPAPPGSLASPDVDEEGDAAPDGPVTG